MNTRTPVAKLGTTINAVTVEFSVAQTKHSVDVPAGTRCCYLEGGAGSGRWVVDDLSFLEPKSFVFHDADHYGIPIEASNVSA